jgi:hypothetical protein
MFAVGLNWREFSAVWAGCKQVSLQTLKDPENEFRMTVCRGCTDTPLDMWFPPERDNPLEKIR